MIESLQIASDEINLKDVVDFSKRNRRQIVFFGLAGLMLSTAYVLLVPHKYEAKWQVRMAQFANANIEEPTALIQRLRVPSVYPVAVRQSCGISEGKEFGEYLDGALEIQAIPHLPAMVEMNVHAPSAMQATQCAEAIVPMIVAQQRDMIEDRLAGRKEQLLQYQESLQNEQRQLDGIRNSELKNFGYLAKLEKLSWFRGRIDALQEEAFLSQLHPAKLMVPIFASKRPIHPKIGQIQALLLGLSFGLMLGVLYSLGREAWCRVSRRDELNA